MHDETHEVVVQDLGSTGAVATARNDVRTTAPILERFERALDTMRGFYDTNHFAEKALKLMRSPARGE